MIERDEEIERIRAVIHGTVYERWSRSTGEWMAYAELLLEALDDARAELDRLRSGLER